MKNKNIILLVIIIILFIIIACIFWTIKSKKGTNETYQKTSGLTPDVDPKDDNILNLGGFGVLFDKYSGEYLSSEVAKKLENITLNLMPKMYDETKTLDEKGLSEYFKKNQKEIINNFGINEEEVFLKFIKTLKSKNQDLNTAYRLDLLKDTFENMSTKSGYAYIEYEVSFKNDNVIRFPLYIARYKGQVPMLILEIK